MSASDQSSGSPAAWSHVRVHVEQLEEQVRRERTAVRWTRLTGRRRMGRRQLPALLLKEALSSAGERSFGRSSSRVAPALFPGRLVAAATHRPHGSR